MRSDIEFFSVYIGNFATAFVFTIVFPFASEMVMTFGEVSDRNKTGYWVGLIASSLMTGRLLSSQIWGYLIDSWGRKPVTQLSLLCMLLLSITFGLSSSLKFSLFIKFLIGVLSPIAISAKVIISELCMKHEVSSSMAWLILSWNIGSISGSLFGGVLSSPVQKGYFQFKFPRRKPLLSSKFITSTRMLHSTYTWTGSI